MAVPIRRLPKDDTDGHDDNDVTDKVRKTPEKETDPDKFKKAIVIVELLGSRAALSLTKRPSEEGLARLSLIQLV
ncbi:hypothetical protein [Escherichia coli]|uniref:hypothetical protein n=1 Tax=Escherichia coli TaxID=562 RepID=UPI00388E12C3